MYKYIKINVLVCVLMSYFMSSVVFANTIDDIVERQKVIFEKSNLSSRNECISVKKNLHHPFFHFSIYFNSIINHILSKNKDILDENEINAEDICVLPDTEDFAYSNREGIIGINPYLLSPSLTNVENDATIAATFAHELAHIILKHNELAEKQHLELFELQVRAKYAKNDYEYNQIKQTYVEKSKNITIQEREHEIEADTLGLKLYLKAGFKPEIFGGSFFPSVLTPYITFSTLQIEPSEYVSNDDVNLFRTTFTLEGCIVSGNKFIQENKFNEFMNRIQYYPTNAIHDDSHQTPCWRYWNAHRNIMSQENEVYRTQNMENLSSHLIPLDGIKKLVEFSRTHDMENSANLILYNSIVSNLINENKQKQINEKDISLTTVFTIGSLLYLHSLVK